MISLLRSVTLGLLAATLIPHSAHADAFSDALAEEGQASMRCNDKHGKKTGVLEVELGDGQDGNQKLIKVCWSVGSAKDCRRPDIEFTGGWNVGPDGLGASCSDQAAEVLLSQSVNYVVYTAVRFKRDGARILYLGARKENPDRDAAVSASKAAPAQLARGEFKTALKTFDEADEDGCMGIGCRATDEEAHTNLVQRARRVGGFFQTAAKKKYQAKNPKAAAGALSEYFEWYLRQGAFHALPAGGVSDPKPAITGDWETSLLARLRDSSNAAFLPLANDWGFYWLEAKDAARAKPILETVTAAAPERAVAHLNLGDALWALGDQAGAKKEYGAYVKRVKAAVVPKSVRERCPDCASLTNAVLSK